MPSQTALISAGATGVAVAAVGAAIYWAHPSFLRPNPVPAVVTEAVRAEPPPPPAPAPDKTVAAAPSPPAPAPVKTAAPATSALAPAAIRPTFDVVSVEATGDAVVAGRAAPNVKVALLDGGKTLAETMSDAQGQFVMIPAPLPPGDHSLTLASGAGSPAETSVVVPVSVAPPPPKVAAAPQPAGAQASPTASLVQPAPAPAGKAEVAIQSVEANAAGGLIARGVAKANATVRLYVSGAYVGDAQTRDDGRWSLTILHGMTPGAYVVRADEIEPSDARVVARAEAPFNVPALAAPEKAASAQPAASSPSDVVVDALQMHHVERGHTLWGISQKFYGDGSRYAIIFSANSEQIRNPNLIYPGQTFVVPKGEPKP
jgi:nucleoid-associated protein YgaU